MEALIIFAAQYLYLAVVLLAIIFWTLQARSGKIELALQLALALMLAFAMVKITNFVWYDPRPFVVDGVSPLIPHAPDSGFPSEHTTYSMVIALVVLFWSRKWGVGLFIIAAIVAWGRAASHVHSVPQVLAGVAFGAVAASAAYSIWRLVLQLQKRQHQTHAEK